MRVQAEPRPDRAQAAEHLVAPEAVAAVDALGPRGRQQPGQVVAGFARGRRRRPRRPPTRAASTRATGRRIRAGSARCRPVQVHVDRQRGRRGAVGEPLLLVAHLGHGQAEAAEVPRHQHIQVAGGAERLEVLSEESVLAVVAGGAFAAGLDQLVDQHASLAPRVLSCPPPYASNARHDHPQI